MINRRRSTHLIIVAAALMALTGCKGGTRIHEITANPEKFDGKHVVLEGTVSVVTEAVRNDASKGGSFVVYDHTGYIRVVTKDYLPFMYDCVDVGGNVQVVKNEDGTPPTVEIVGHYQTKPASEARHFVYGPLPKEYGN
jgi:hypothetical protein